MIHPSYTALRVFILAILVSFTCACQPTVYLMPTPAVLATGEHNPFAANPDLEESPLISVLYATNRLPVGKTSDRFYTIWVGDDLRFGEADIRIGTEESAWEKLLQISTSEAPDDRPQLVLENLDEMAVIEPGEDPGALTPKIQAFFDRLNDSLSSGFDSDLTIYVHGANSNIYRAAAQAAQYRHFTGRNTTLLAFFWPSAESILRYALDVDHAYQSASYFTRCIELLARHTHARGINILAYSAGAQVVSPALATLGNISKGDPTLKDRLRLKEIYFAAPDIDLQAFANDFSSYGDLPRSVTLSLNVNDGVLSYAERHHGVSRAGRPNIVDLSSGEIAMLADASEKGRFDIIAVDPETIPNMAAGAHNFWYDHPWVSSDVLIQFLFHVDHESVVSTILCEIILVHFL